MNNKDGQIKIQNFSYQSSDCEYHSPDCKHQSPDCKY